ncbi:3-keto-5-aminohexanoate cleavage protein [Mesorhizobium sp. M7A.T.Ca.TU.009.02.1.1]|uniref:3-keto-5-aminohexanoate cleavage protein n=2 Tax=unclassified Mesorhizobium TaxID=325217 RepID=UPI000FCBCC2A|nr:3-keto-5-aminohexanoate cleavage protein [Mesorhizobium sp. M7A.T.Ca.TU.009.02.1.1]RUT99951.1 hypothetical protein EOD12_20470 [Mesorhizobium sp. M7A.T.Ca.TU.009.02.1.1]
MLRNLVRKLPLFDLYPDHLAYLLYQSDTLWPQSASVNEASARRTARVSKSSATTSAISTLAIRRAGLVNASFSVQSLFGTQWHRHSSRGRGAYEAHRRPAVRTGSPLVGAGRRSQPLRWPPQAIAAGCDVRVGLEDWLWIGKGQLAKSTAEWVILRLKGSDKTASGFEKAYGTVRVIHGVSVDIGSGEFVILVGPSTLRRSRATSCSRTMRTTRTCQRARPWSSR